MLVVRLAREGVDITAGRCSRIGHVRDMSLTNKKIMSCSGLVASKHG